MSPSRRHDVGWFALALGLAALALPATPPVYRGLVDLGWLNPADAAGGDPFGKVLRRLLLVPGALVLVVGLRPWRDLGLTAMGLRGPNARPRAGASAFAVSLLVIGAMLALHVACGWLVVEVTDPARAVAGRVRNALLSALVVAVLENWLFRAWLPVLAARWVGARFADAAAVLLFGLAHAFRATNLDGPVSHDTAGAWDALRSWLRTMLDPVSFGPAFLGLVLFGALLTVAYRRTRSLWVPIGIHAACIVSLLTYGAFSERRDTPAWAGTKNLYDGLPGWTVLLLAALWMARRAGAAAPTSPAPAASDAPA